MTFLQKYTVTHFGFACLETCLFSLYLGGAAGYSLAFELLEDGQLRLKLPVVCLHQGQLLPLGQHQANCCPWDSTGASRGSTSQATSLATSMRWWQGWL